MPRTFIELDDEEASALRTALDEHLHSLRTEFASTETRLYRARLLEAMNTLEGIAARLAAVAGPDEATAPPR